MLSDVTDDNYNFVLDVYMLSFFGHLYSTRCKLLPMAAHVDLLLIINYLTYTK
jgi:hypothetical protein